MKKLLLILSLTMIFNNIIAQKTAEDYFKLGMIKEDLDEVIWNFTKAIEIKPDYLDAYYFRAIAYLNYKKYDKSLIDVDKVLKLDSTKAEYLNLKGKILLNFKDGYIDAFQYFNKAIELNPNLAEAYYQRGIIKNRTENNLIQTKGCEDLKTAKKLGYKVPEIEIKNCKEK